MRVPQLESRLIMIKRPELVEALRRVAFGAALIREFVMELVFVLVGVAIDTEFLIRRREFKNLFLLNQMTIIAGDPGVFSIQWESGLGVIKVFGLLVKLPTLGHVAFGAFLGEKLLRKNTDVRAPVAVFASFLF